MPASTGISKLSSFKELHPFLKVKQGILKTPIHYLFLFGKQVRLTVGLLVVPTVTDPDNCELVLRGLDLKTKAVFLVNSKF